MGSGGALAIFVVMGVLASSALGAKPVVEGGGLTSNTPFSASVNTTVNPENESTTCVFKYGETALSTTTPCQPETLEGEGAQEVSVSLSNLKPNTTYHYRFAAENGSGKTEGAEGEFTTLPAERPIVESENVSNVTSEGAKLEAQINPNYQKTIYAFEYAASVEELENEEGEFVLGTETLPGVFEGRAVSTKLSGLEPGEPYFYRIVTENASGIQDGAPVAFQTLALPTVTTGPATQITRTAANISGTVNPGGAQTLAQVAYIKQELYEKAAKEDPEDPYAADGGHLSSSMLIPQADFVVHSVGPFELRELQAGTTYDYAVVATNLEGTTIGPKATFTTSPATPPIVTTGAAVGVTPNGATLTGSVDTRGLPTTMSFEMGDTPGLLGAPEPASAVPASGSGTTTEVSLPTGNSLLPGTTYYYRAQASNVDGVSYGEVKAFTTPTFQLPPTYNAPTIPVLPAVKVPPAPKTSGSGSGSKHKKKSGSSKLTKALKACAKQPKSKRAACKRQARKKYGKKG